MPDFPQMARVNVDFNDMDQDGRLFVLPEDAEHPLWQHALVVLGDAEGNHARGRVVEIRDGGRAVIEMIAGSWLSREAASATELFLSPQDQVAILMAPYVWNPGSFGGWYRFSEGPSGVAAVAASPASALSQPRGAVPSSL